MAPRAAAAKKIEAPPVTRSDAANIREGMHRLDGWVNLLSGLGANGFDKRKDAKVAPPRIWTPEEIDALYCGNDIASTIVDVPADELVRRWFKFEHDAEDVEDDTSKAVMGKLEDLNAVTHFSDGPRWGNAFGGAAVVMGIQDGNDPALPVDEARIQSVDWLSTLDRYELIPEYVVGENPFAYLMNPTNYRIVPPSIENDDKNPSKVKAAQIAAMRAKPNSIDTPSGALIHSSRICRFDGPKTPRRRRWRNDGWSDSLYTRIEEILIDFNLSWSSAAVLLQDFSQAIWKIKGLSEILASDNADAVTTRMKALQLARSVVRAVMLDADNEEFERKTTEVAGLFEGLAAFATRLAAAARMPVTKLFGQAPAGLNATGDADVRNWYDQLASKQTIILRPALNKFIRYVLLSKQGPTKGVEPKNWTIKFHPLWTPSDTERSTIRMNEATRANTLVTCQAIMPEEVSSALAASDGDFLDLKPDMDLREQLAAQKEEQAQAQMEADAKAKAEADKTGIAPQPRAKPVPGAKPVTPPPKE